MKNTLRAAIAAVAIVVAVVATWYFSSAPEQSKPIALVYQSNRFGSLEPCTCDMNPNGGIDREWNAVQALKATSATVLSVDAGNMLAPEKLTGSMTEAREKADFVASMVKEVGVEVFAPGPNDYALGLETVEKAGKTLGAQLVSTNLVRGKDGETVFAPYVVKEKGGVRFSFLSVSPEVPGLNHQSADEALKRWLPEAKAKADMVILLSQLPVQETQRILKAYPEISLAVGADPKQVFVDPVWYSDGGKLLIDPQNSAFYLGILKFEPKLPFKGFYSPVRVAKNAEKRQTLEAKLAIPTEAASAKEALTLLRRFEPLEPISGGSAYDHELLALTPQQYGKPNALTDRMNQRKAMLKKSALLEE